MTEKNYELAEKAYNAYAQSTNYKSAVTGDDLPVFDVLKVEIKDAWYAAANAVAESFGYGVAGGQQTQDAPTACEAGPAPVSEAA